MKSIYSFLGRLNFGDVISAEGEQKKLGILRFFLGVIVLARFAQMFYAGLFLSPYDTLPFMVAGAATITVILFFTFGFFTVVAGLLLIIAAPVMDKMYGTSTLGTAILLQFLFVFLFTNHGLHYSVDAYLVKQNSSIGRAIRKLYHIIGRAGPRDIKIVYLFAFLSYGVVSFGALSHHLADQYWLSGDTVALFFTGAFLSTHYLLFRDFATSFPAAYEVISYGLVLGQSIFQFFMIPLAFHRYTRYFVVVWGMAFFVASLLFINLSYLPHVEILLWLALFTRSGVKAEIMILFDDKCNLCRNALKVLRFANVNNRLVFIPISEGQEMIAQYNLDATAVRTWMYGISQGTVYRGYDLYIKIVHASPLLWLFLPLIYLGKWTRIGYWVYAKIAEKRYALFGTCQISIAKHSSRFFAVPYRTTVRYGFTIMYIVVISSYILFRFPYVHGIPKRALTIAGLPFKPVRDVVANVAYRFGFDMPIVFNEEDLRMNERWFVLYRLRYGQKELVPIMDEMGGRMNMIGNDIWMLKNHGSDLLYFGLTLKYCREMIGADIEKAHEQGAEGHGLLMNLAELDRKLNNIPPDVTYYYEIRENRCVSGYRSCSGGEQFSYKTIYHDTL